MKSATSRNLFKMTFGAKLLALSVAPGRDLTSIRFLVHLDTTVNNTKLVK
jgi:hypothetical protein